MEWTQALTVILSIFGMMLFMIREIRQVSRDIAIEMRDFHGRLCILEEKYMQMMNRFMQEKNK